MNPIRISLIGAAMAAQSFGGTAYDGKPGTFVVMDTTLGRVVLQLDSAKAPISTLNFIRYCEAGHYNGTVFHRVIPNFMIQGGGFDPAMDEKRGTRAPIRNEWRNGLMNKKYTVAMARTSDPDSATAQFFINTVDNDRLSDPVACGGAAYAVFGKVVEGTEVVDKIRDSKCIMHPKYPVGQAVTPEQAVVITSAMVTGDYDRNALQNAVDNTEKKVIEDKKKSEAAAALLIDKVVADLEATHKSKFTRTGSGLRYLAVSPGAGAKPTGRSTVTVHYEGKLVDGKIFDSSYQRNEKISFPLNGVIAGWTEGLQLMSLGAKYIFVIPPELGYGSRGAGGAIPPNATLIFTVELFNIE